MAATPFIIKASPRLADRAAEVGFLKRIAPIEREELGAEVAHEELEDHLVVVGFGIGGKNLVRAAKQARISYLILEMNPDTVRSGAENGEPITYGDATHKAVLEHAGIQRARVLAVLVPDPASVRRITAAAKAVNPGLHVIARTRFVSEIEPLRKLGAKDVVPEEFETSIEIFSRVLKEYLVPRDEIERFAEEIRAEGYGILRGPERKGALGRLAGGFKELELSGIRVHEGSFMDGLSLEKSGLRREHGLTLVAIERDGQVTANPHGDFVLKAGDTAYVFGPHKKVSEKCRLFSSEC
jgi:CPA2 family monovalent cation:H+ antiporter-2